ncbi:low molecular weight phosphatase family protein [Serinicoccus sp. LYQ131]|uniref:arsenate reductase/protein-tyrosine-phosphatase family protein n=1 Tax=Serinicoccus sp. LYQ131 TaxID=3378797 RepID=UPI003852EFFF
MSTPVVLVVCTGNVCRSPLLERVLQDRFDSAAGPGSVRVRSAGTAALVGSGMDVRSAALLGDLGGGPAGDFTARRLSAGMVQEAALVLTAAREHRADVVRLDPRALRRTFTVRELAALLRHVPAEELPSWEDPGAALRQLTEGARGARGALLTGGPLDLDIVDPYRRGDEVYVQVRDQVRAALGPLERALSGGAATS